MTDDTQAGLRLPLTPPSSTSTSPPPPAALDTDLLEELGAVLDERFAAIEARLDTLEGSAPVDQEPAAEVEPEQAAGAVPLGHPEETR